MALRITRAVTGAGGPARIARATGIPLRTLNNYRTGRSQAKAGRLRQIARVCGVRLEWLLTGEEPMLGIGLADSAEQAKFEIGSSNVILIPFYEELRASAGDGALVETEAFKPVSFSHQWLRDVLCVNPAHLGMMRSKGDSMMPTIRDGELLLFDMSAEGRALDDGVFIMRLDGAILLKRLQRMPGNQVKIISDNQSYPPYVIDLNDGTDFAIVGRVEVKFGRI